jgi:hypothetical protein
MFGVCEFLFNFHKASSKYISFTRQCYCLSAVGIFIFLKINWGGTFSLGRVVLNFEFFG